MNCCKIQRISIIAKTPPFHCHWGVSRYCIVQWKRRNVTVNCSKSGRTSQLAVDWHKLQLDNIIGGGASSSVDWHITVRREFLKNAWLNERIADFKWVRSRESGHKGWLEKKTFFFQYLNSTPGQEVWVFLSRIFKSTINFLYGVLSLCR